MKIETKFDIGQYVYAVTNSTQVVYDQCPACSGIGKINLNGKDYSCPECHGNRVKERIKPKAYRIVYHSQVGKINIEKYADQCIETYMLKSTGVGSGTIWHRENLFANKKEAEEYCRKMNNGLEDDVDAISDTLVEEVKSILEL